MFAHCVATDMRQRQDEWSDVHALGPAASAARIDSFAAFSASVPVGAAPDGASRVSTATHTHELTKTCKAHTTMHLP